MVAPSGNIRIKVCLIVIALSMVGAVVMTWYRPLVQYNVDESVLVQLDHAIEVYDCHHAPEFVRSMIGDEAARALFGTDIHLEVTLEGVDLNTRNVRLLHHYPHVTSLLIKNGPELGDDLLQQMSQIKNLHTLRIWSTPVSDASLSKMTQFETLKILSIANCGISDEGLAHLASINTLEVIYIAEDRITNEGIKKIEDGLTDTTIHFNRVFSSQQRVDEQGGVAK